jgi:hypothetical protein
MPFAVLIVRGAYGYDSQGRVGFQHTDWAILGVPKGAGVYDVYCWIHTKQGDSSGGGYPSFSPFTPTEVTFVGDITILFRCSVSTRSAVINVDKVVYL